MTSSALKVRRIDHVTFVVKDLARSRAFYEGLLGMDVVPRPAFNFEGMWLQAGQTLLHLIREYAESGPAGMSRPETAIVSRTHHLAFEVEAGQPAVDRIRELGIEIVSGPKFRPDGPMQMFILDPDGHVIELYAHQ